MGDDRAKILIIDDDPDFAETTQAMLESADYEVCLAEDGKKGLDMIIQEEPDLVILDIMMESMFEGFSVISTLRGTPEFIDYRDIPVIMVSAVRQEYGSRFSLPEGGEHLQGDVYMDKPIKAKELLETVARLLAENR
ncbi:MAG: response regulator [Proteobacteria bacterium]|nr:response regulator [Pseudomonadota bacterium]